VCTAISYNTIAHYFGRNLDLEYSYQEQVTFTPRNYPFRYRNGCTDSTHYAMIGMATVDHGYPLYYEATNEMGLSMAGLNFPGNAVYHCHNKNQVNLASFEMIPWILSKCEDVLQATDELSKINLWNEAYSDKIPPSPLHWMIADHNRTIVVEPREEGLRIYENPVHIMTNNPPFDYHLVHLSQYLSLSANTPVNHFSKDICLKPFSLGMGSLGLPGDPSSPSRFVKAAFVLHNSKHPHTESASVNQFFHILSSVAQQKGITYVKDGKYEFTQYSSCCNTQKGIYYYSTYENTSVTAINMHFANLSSSNLITFPLRKEWNVFFEN
jgi:choloylglycine hydrolase